MELHARDCATSRCRIHAKRRDGIPGGRISTLPPGRGLQAASASERHGRNDWAVGLGAMKRRKRRAPTCFQSGAVAGCALPEPRLGFGVEVRGGNCTMTQSMKAFASIPALL